jgi:hypothetical protein
MHDRDVAVLDLKYDDLADVDRIRLVVQEENVAALKRGLHAAAEHNDDRTLAASHHDQRLPDHQRGEDDHGEVQDLVEQAPLLLRQRAQHLPLVIRRDDDVFVHPTLNSHRLQSCAARAVWEGQPSVRAGASRIVG